MILLSLWLKYISLLRSAKRLREWCITLLESFFFFFLLHEDMFDPDNFEPSDFWIDVTYINLVNVNNDQILNKISPVKLIILIFTT